VDDPTLLEGAELSIKELPRSYWARNEDGIYFLTIGKLGQLGPGAGCDGPFSKIARDLRIRGTAGDTVTLVDFKAGFEDSVRGALTGLDWAIHVVDPTTSSLEMAREMVEMVDEIRAGSPPATEHLESPELVELAKGIYKSARIKDVLVVLNQVSDAEVESLMRESLEEMGIVPLGTIHHDPSIARSWLKGTTLASGGTRADVEGIVCAIEKMASGAFSKVC
jgi:CO dehydrogenase nickel-insertion accessory protein CooC1